MTPALAPVEVFRYTSGMATVTEALRKALANCGRTRYAVSKATGINESTLSRFVVGGKPLQGTNIDTLAEHLGLELVAKHGKAKGRRR